MMGFYHYLNVFKQNGEKVDIGGYSKGGSWPHWWLAFSPTEYSNNLEEVVEKKDSRIAFVGYKTKVEKAIKRLEKYYDRLREVERKPKLLKDDKKYNQYRDDIFKLTYVLEQFSPLDDLVLDQTDGSGYALIYKKNEIVGLTDYWYMNGAADNEKDISSFEKSNTTLEEMIEDVSNSMVDQVIEHFFDELRWIAAESDRGCGPHPVTELLSDNVNLCSDNPKIAFNNIMNEMMAKCTASKEKRTLNQNLMNLSPKEFLESDEAFARYIDENDVKEGVSILNSLILETLDLEYLKVK